MTPLWFLNLALKCINLLSWPLLALGYPLCASIQAIESDSHSDTRNLISYWILFSLIYLFEYAFHKLLQWFQYWPYIKLMIIVWLMIPDFGRASYVYNRLIYSCTSMNPLEVISWFRDSKKENFLIQTEKYITENGTETLEKIIASKKQMAQNLDAEGIKAVPATEKNEMQQTNKVRLDVEQKDIKDLEMIEKKEVPESKQGNAAATNHELNVNISSATVQIEGTAGKVIADREFLESCASKKVQKEWKAKNQQPGKMKDIEVADGSNLSIVQTNKVRLDVEQKDIKDLEMIEKKEGPESKQGNAAATNHELNVNISSTTVQIEGTAGKVIADREFLESCASKEVQQEWTCAMCQVTTTSENDLRSHLSGWKHITTFEALKAKNQQLGKIKDIDNSLRQKITANQQAKIEQKYIPVSKSMLSDEPRARIIKDEKNKSQVVHGNTKMQKLQKSMGTSVGMRNSRLRCEICNVNCSSEGDMASHLKGRKHCLNASFHC